MFSTGNAMDRLRTSRSVRIFASNMPSSVCATKILALLLHKELVKFEICFASAHADHPPDSLCVFVDLAPGTCGNALLLSEIPAVFACSCASNSLRPCILAYSLAKSINYVNSDVLWPMIVCFEFYRIFTRDVFPEKESEDSDEDEHSLEDMCMGCRELHTDLVFEVQKEAVCTIDGIYYRKRPRVSFLNHSSLFSALHNDIPFVLQKRIYYKRDKRLEEQKIHEYLARKGISQRNAHEAYSNLGFQARHLVESQFTQTKAFYKRVGHDVEISPMENFFLVCHHLLRNSAVEAFLSLSKGIGDMDRSIELHQQLVGIYRDCIANARRLGKTLFFQVKAPASMKGLSAELLMHLYILYFRMFIRQRHANAFSQVVVLEDCMDTLVVGSDDTHVAEKMEGLGERVGEGVAMDRVVFARFVKRLGDVC